MPRKKKRIVTEEEDKEDIITNGKDWVTIPQGKPQVTLYEDSIFKNTTIDIKLNNNPKTTVAYVWDHHALLCEKAREIIQTKGRDYNRQEQGEKQGEGDTLANMRLSKHIGLTDSYCQSTLVRLFDKMMRLKSLCKDPTTFHGAPATINETVRDTIIDMINYLVYLDIFYGEESGNSEHSSIA